MVDNLYTKFVAERRIEGMTSSQICTAWADSEEAEAQQTADAFVARLKLKNRIATLCRAGDYYVEDGRLYTSLGDGTYESSAFILEEGQLVLSDCDNAAPYQAIGLSFPLTLSPVTE